MLLTRANLATWLLRIAVAGVWLYQGLWNKLLSPHGRHAQIVASAPSVLGSTPTVVLTLLGAAEVVLGLWVLSGFAPRLAAVFQTVLLVGMNLGGLLWAREAIADPGGMIVQNIAFLALIWVVAERDTSLNRRGG